MQQGMASQSFSLSSKAALKGLVNSHHGKEEMLTKDQTEWISKGTGSSACKMRHKNLFPNKTFGIALAPLHDGELSQEKSFVSPPPCLHSPPAGGGSAPAVGVQPAAPSWERKPLPSPSGTPGLGGTAPCCPHSNTPQRGPGLRGCSFQPGRAQDALPGTGTGWGHQMGMASRDHG